MFLKQLIVALAFIVTIKCQIIVEEKCPNIKVVENFDLHKYLGTWYTYKRIPTSFDQDSKCSLATYSLNPNGTVGVLNESVDENDIVNSIMGWAKIYAPGILQVEFPCTGAPAANEPNYYILDTDYTGYSVVYSCKNIDDNKSEIYIWMLTKDRNPCETTIKEGEEALGDQSFDIEKMVKVDQSDCPAR